MPRPRRQIFPNECYHLLNRANRKAEVFHELADYAGFLALMARAQGHVELPILAACLMPNHIHLVIRPTTKDAVTRWTKWLFTTHAVHYHRKYSTTGHVWQGRFKAFLVQDNNYLMTLLRYVERNARRANLVGSAADWPWGSLNWRTRRDPPLALAPLPMALPSWWSEFVDQPQTALELEAIRTSVNRQRPYGDPTWVKQIALERGLEQTLAEAGRPRKEKPK